MSYAFLEKIEVHMLTQPGLEQSNLARESPESGHFIQRKVTTEPPISPAVIGLSWLIT